MNAQNRLKVLLVGSLLLLTAPAMESVTPLPFEQSLLMCFTSPLQFHIPEKLGCSKKLEIQRGLFLLFFFSLSFCSSGEVDHYQVRETPTRVTPRTLNSLQVQPLSLPLCCEMRDVVLSRLSPWCPVALPTQQCTQIQQHQCSWVPAAALSLPGDGEEPQAL